jgi:hypothetical protein
MAGGDRIANPERGAGSNPAPRVALWCTQPMQARYGRHSTGPAWVQRCQSRLSAVHGLMSNVTPIRQPDRSLPPLIGLGGHLGAGKDALAEHIAEKYGATVLGMSAPLVRAMQALNPVIPLFVPGVNTKYVPTGRYTTYRELHQSVGYVGAKKNPEVRRLYQTLGTQVGRDMIGDDVWVDMARRDIQALREDGEAVLITGIRFPNELQMIQGQGGKLVWVERDESYEAYDRGQDRPLEAYKHESENSVRYTDFDVVVENFGDLEGLYASADTLWEGIVLERGRQHPANPGWGTRYDW